MAKKKSKTLLIIGITFSVLLIISLIIFAFTKTIEQTSLSFDCQEKEWKQLYQDDIGTALLECDNDNFCKDFVLDQGANSDIEIRCNQNICEVNFEKCDLP